MPIADRRSPIADRRSPIADRRVRDHISHQWRRDARGLGVVARQPISPRRRQRAARELANLTGDTDDLPWEGLRGKGLQRWNVTLIPQHAEGDRGVSNNMIRVLVATDDCLYREGIEAILMAHEHTAVVEAAPDFFAAVASVDVALLDVTTRDSLTTLAGIRRCEQPPKVVAISVHDEPHTVLRWIESGCSGYVSRSATAGALLRAVRDTHHGELVFEPRLVSAVVNRLTSLAEKVAPNHVSPVALTAREKQILNLVSQGIPDKLIAAHLGISLATAKNHLHRVFEKTGVHSRHRLRMQIAD